MNILIANAGSTSFKFQLFDGASLVERAGGRLERIGRSDAPVQYNRPGKEPALRTVALPDYGTAIQLSIELLTDPDIGVIKNLSEIAAVGFKPVHALEITGCRMFSDEILEKMEQATPLAPAHNPPYIGAVKLFRDMLPGLPLYGLFEPTFHETAPDYARVYGVPYEWITRHGLRRYGFHGASHRHIAERAPERLGRPAHDLRLVSCHLGGSSSVCAIRSGASIDTSMGLTPQSGLMQSSRSGDLDPFGVLMVMDREGWTTDEMRRALCRESGLKGLSGVGSGDMRDLLEAEKQGNDRARLAVQAFTYEIKKYIGAYAAALGGVDALVFTGGMGERSAEIRRRVCEGLDFLGINLDHRLNNALDGEGIISPSTAPVSVLVIPANEERIIACEVIKALERA